MTEANKKDLKRLIIVAIAMATLIFTNEKFNWAEAILDWFK